MHTLFPQVLLDYKNSTAFQTTTDSVVHSMPTLSSHNGENLRTVFHIGRKQSVPHAMFFLKHGQLFLQ